MIQRCDNRMFFARQGSVSQANFMRQATTEPPKFAGPGRRTSGSKKLHSKKKIHSFESNG